MNWERLIHPVMKTLRLRRLTRFVKAFPDLPGLSVLYVGGRPMIWRMLKEHYGLKPARLVLLNTESEIGLADGYQTAVGDGCHLGYEDESFDLVFSNSVIEHVGDWNEMQQFVHECSKVGKEIYIQTPNRWFPVEPHTVTIFIYWFPKNVFRRFGFLTAVWWVNGADDFYSTCDDFHLLSRREFQALSPHGHLWIERFFGLPKSFVISSKAL